MKFDTDPGLFFSTKSKSAVPIRRIDPKALKARGNGLDAQARAWIAATGFTAAAGEICCVPDRDNKIALVLFGEGDGPAHPLAHGALARSLPAGTYRFEGGGGAPLDDLGWAMGGYRYNRYRNDSDAPPKLVRSAGAEANRLAQGVYVARDLINTPASDMGPKQLEQAARKIAKAHQARVTVTKGDDLLKKNFPMVHAVGRASSEAPRVLDMRWGHAKHPKITLVGKGVTFDTGGLNVKPGSSMALMKKDMGGAANVLGLAHMIMDARLPVRLRVIIGAVENAISGNAFRPGDVLPTRKGIHVEIGNTDAEGRLVLGDCLALGDEEAPELMVDMATLTGAARVALGPDIAPFYTGDDKLADALATSGSNVADPVWRMPLWQPYHGLMSSRIADVNHINTSGTGFAGSVTAALFLSRFVERAKSWAHFDIYGWVPAEKPWARVGGEAQGIRALYDVLAQRY